MNTRRVAALAVFVLSLSAWAAVAAPRPISDAERAATQIAADYLSRGPQAVADHLASASPMRKFSAADQLAEIEARLGPPAGATWELQTAVPAIADRTAVFGIEYPSGIDDTAVIELVKEGSGYAVNDIRILGLKSPKPQIFPATEVPAATPTEPQPKSGFPNAALGMLAIVIAAALAVAGALTRSSNRALSLAATTLALVIGIGTAAFAIVKDARFGIAHNEEVAAKPKEETNAYPRLATLLALRRAIAAGSSEIDALLASPPHNADAAAVAKLWKAQWDLQQSRTDAAKKTLATFPKPSDIPLVEILRARAALLENDEVSSVIAYERAVNLGPGRDGLWYETAQALLGLGFDDRARAYIDRLADIGSRSADAAYLRALLDAQHNREADSEKALLEAWAMRPVERWELVQAAVLWSVLRRPAVSSTISLAVADEATFGAPDALTRSIALPPSAWPTISGSFLHVQIADQQLLVPGGAAIAPAGTPTVDAAAWQRDEDARVLKQLPQLASGNDAAFAQPALRRRVLRAANALAARNRWKDLIDLTNGVNPKADHVPPRLFFLRSVALEHSDRIPDARQLIIGLAGSHVLQRNNDSQALEELGEQLAALDEFDAAVKMYAKALAITPNPGVDDRLRQIEMNKRLATGMRTLTTPHFELHYPQDVSPSFAELMGSILEKEYARLQAYVRTPDFKPVVVNVLQWQDFRSTYTGSDFILGFYQGKITLPFGGVGRFSPEVVAILSHELLHALLAQATHDQAPRWFQEGMAQRIEMVEFMRNAFNTYTDDKLLAVSLLDAVLRGSPDPEMITESYIESQTAIRYIESRYGQAGLQRMIVAFRDGATTEEAIRQLTGGTVAQFDKDLRTWGRSTARVFEGAPIVHYDDDPDAVKVTRRGM